MIILGIDPGTTTTGFGVIKSQKNKVKYIAHGIISTRAKTQQQKRLQILYNQTIKVLEEYKPDLMVIEKLFFFKNPKTVMQVSEARGVMLLAAEKRKTLIQEITPLQIKMGICGYARIHRFI